MLVLLAVELGERAIDRRARLSLRGHLALQPGASQSKRTVDALQRGHVGAGGRCVGGLGGLGPIGAELRFARRLDGALRSLARLPKCCLVGIHGRAELRLERLLLRSRLLQTKPQALSLLRHPRRRLGRRILLGQELLARRSKVRQDGRALGLELRGEAAGIDCWRVRHARRQRGRLLERLSRQDFPALTQRLKLLLEPLSPRSLHGLLLGGALSLRARLLQGALEHQALLRLGDHLIALLGGSGERGRRLAVCGFLRGREPLLRLGQRPRGIGASLCERALLVRLRERAHLLDRAFSIGERALDGRSLVTKSRIQSLRQLSDALRLGDGLGRR